MYVAWLGLLNVFTRMCYVEYIWSVAVNCLVLCRLYVINLSSWLFLFISRGHWWKNPLLFHHPSHAYIKLALNCLVLHRLYVINLSSWLSLLISIGHWWKNPLLFYHPSHTYIKLERHFFGNVHDLFLPYSGKKEHRNLVSKPMRSLFGIWNLAYKIW
jgi:hypothetical protein